jgi:hypothetical protein
MNNQGRAAVSAAVESNRAVLARLVQLERERDAARAEVAALRAVADAARVVNRLPYAGQPWYDLDNALRALAALPARDAAPAGTEGDGGEADA